MSTLKRLEPMLLPWIFFSRRKALPSSSIFWPTGIIPITVAVPPGRRQSKHCSAAFFKPMASKEKSTPPPVISRIAGTGSCAEASTTWVAPSSRAVASLWPCTSTAMIIRAPPMRAPWIAARPTPPQPNTATMEPGSTRAVFRAAPTPVGDAAADEGRAVERHVVAHLHDRVLVDEHLLGVCGEVGELGDRRALPAELGRRVLGPDRPAAAEVGAAGEAVLAVAAEDGQAGDDVVSRLEIV